MSILQLSGCFLLFEALSSVALQLNCRLIDDYHVVKHLLTDIVNAPVKPLVYSYPYSIYIIYCFVLVHRLCVLRIFELNRFSCCLNSSDYD